MSLRHPVPTRGGDHRWKTRVYKQPHGCTWNAITHEISDSSLMRFQISRVMGVEVQTNASFAFLYQESHHSWDLKSHQTENWNLVSDVLSGTNASSCLHLKSHHSWDFSFRFQFMRIQISWAMRFLVQMRAAFLKCFCFVKLEFHLWSPPSVDF